MREPGERRNFRFAWRVAILLANGLGLIFLALLLLLAATAYVVFPRVAGSSQVRAMLAQRLEDTLHRPASIGRVVIAPQGIKISTVKIANELPGEGDLLDGESAIVTIKLLPLLRRRLEIKTISIFHPVIRLVREKDGSWSFSDVFHSTAAARAPNPLFFSMPISLYAEKTVIHNADVIIDDRYRKRTITFSDLDMTIRKPDARTPFPFTASFANSFQFKNRKITADCTLAGTASLAGLHLASATANAYAASVKVDGAVFNGTLSLRDFLHPSVRGNFLAPALSQSWLSAQTGRPATFPWPQSRWSFALEFPSARLMRVPELDMTAQAFSTQASGTVDFSSAPFSLQAQVRVSSAPLQNFSFLASGISRDQIRPDAGRRAHQRPLEPPARGPGGHAAGKFLGELQAPLHFSRPDLGLRHEEFRGVLALGRAGLPARPGPFLDRRVPAGEPGPQPARGPAAGFRLGRDPRDCQRQHPKHGAAGPHLSAGVVWTAALGQRPEARRRRRRLLFQAPARALQGSSAVSRAPLGGLFQVSYPAPLPGHLRAH
ncbi:MAG TPA: AsmA family protein, partial [Elusimicrobiota bacterium]|nr:AsmA family protein [Elusimicrobiota bacterium]